MARRCQKIGLLGGTFDPVHLGHMQLAARVCEIAEVDRILFIPCLSPPHKPYQSTPFADRVAMLELALKNHDCYSYTTIEQKLSPPTYSIDMLRLLARELELAASVFILGSDTLLDIESWKDYLEVLRSINILMVPRIGYPVDEVDGLLTRLGYTREGLDWQRKGYGCTISLVPIEMPQISSSEIRSTYRLGAKYSDLVPSQVNDYIIRHNLYPST